LQEALRLTGADACATLSQPNNRKFSGVDPGVQAGTPKPGERFNSLQFQQCVRDRDRLKWLGVFGNPIGARLAVHELSRLSMNAGKQTLLLGTPTDSDKTDPTCTPLRTRKIAAPTGRGT
jgi:hypothetical protein